MKKANMLLASCATLIIAGITQSSAQTSAEKISAGDTRKEVAVTIYNENLALVREVRDLDLQKGVNHFALRDVSGMIRPETAIMTTKDNAKLYVIEQNFNFDLLTPDALTEKYVGKEVTIVRLNQDGSEAEEKATILSNNSGLVLKYNDRIEIGLPKDARIKFDALPQNLRDRPTLVTDIMSEETGTKEVNIAYLSGGFNWKADYVAELNKDENKISLKGWVTLQNNSGTSYQDAKLQLVAGDVNQAEFPRRGDAIRLMADASQDEVMATAAPIQQEALLDYHLYTLPLPTTLNNNQIKQVALMGADNVPVQKRYVAETLRDYYAFNNANEEGQPLTVGVYFNFVNDKDSNLGVPLPKGVLRAYKPDSKGNVLFIGEDSINHIADKETVRVKFGNAFDVKVYAKTLERKEVGLSFNSNPIYETTNELTVKNAKDEPVEVEIPAYFPDNWEMLQENIPHEKRNANTAIWRVKVDPKSASVLTFKVRTKN
ncbi:DUF4139 domain-containing protein [Bartonella sp. HY329]|uniref:DUF4139 domain-containing protein n=1 Tax=unclassified Bartonella TaxID=2645622 RepID=UPI0021CA769F|nr:MULTISPECIES: DUF4139 domain-containing protein [unclassified Bartonella]UXM95654.1 DUF4139 domain-containing protein [Bartonella sp. HY329]UXN09979.1 DUF4139 domain-containing protein [Bartonella sp. HY328]